MTFLILVVDDEADVEALFRQHFWRELRDGRFVMDSRNPDRPPCSASGTRKSHRSS